MRAIKEIAILTTLTLGVTLPVGSQITSSDFDAISNSFNEALKEIDNEGMQATQDIAAEYDALQRNIDAEYEQFKQEVAGIWGEKSATVSDRYRWVEYDEDHRSRSIVDFESGEVDIELVLSDDELRDEAKVEAKVVELVERLAASKGSTVAYDSKYIEKQELSQSPIMDGIIDIRASNIARGSEIEATTTATATTKESTSSNIEMAAYVESLRKKLKSLQGETAQQSEAAEKSERAAKVEPSGTKAAVNTTITKVQSADGERNVVKIKSNLRSDYMSSMAKRYEGAIVSNAARFNISPTLIYAIMETESAFNPEATSHVPAYGLMQIVPKYAGRDAYKHLYGEDKIVSRSYLFQANKNIEMGVGYLNILSSRYFKGVTDYSCRELCMIAAYNTGAGNVSRAMVGHTNVYKSIDKINSMSYSELYSHMRRNLPFKETRDYIEKVTTKRKKYSRE